MVYRHYYCFITAIIPAYLCAGDRLRPRARTSWIPTGGGRTWHLMRHPFIATSTGSEIQNIGCKIEATDYVFPLVNESSASSSDR